MNMASLIPRQIETRLLEALQDTPVVLLAGPRQAGKTTLVKQIAERQGLRYLTMDDELALLSAKEDPTGFIRSIDCVVIERQQPGWACADDGDLGFHERLSRVL